MHFKIIIPMYNVENWVETTVKSVLSQTYKNYQCIIVDDMSTDESYEIVKKLISTDDRFILVKNEEKKYALKNIVDAINISNPSVEDVIVTLDGDDWFTNINVLETIKNVYEKQNCLVTYGNHINYPDGLPYWSLFEYPSDVVENNSYRSFRFLASHLRTFKYKVWKKIKQEDLLDSSGAYFKMGWDLAIMFPMLEMTGEKAFFVKDACYVYNNQNPLNDYKVDHKLQFSTEIAIRTKQKYERVEMF